MTDKVLDLVSRFVSFIDYDIWGDYEYECNPDEMNMEDLKNEFVSMLDQLNLKIVPKDE